MLPPTFFKRLPEMSYEQLFVILTHPHFYTLEAVEAVRTDLHRRNFPEDRIAQLNAEGEEALSRWPKKKSFFPNLFSSPWLAISRVEHEMTEVDPIGWTKKRASLDGVRG